MGRKLYRLHHESTVHTIQNQIADFGELPFDNRFMLARCRFAAKRGSGIELARAEIQLHADVRRNHRTENGEPSLTIHT